MKKNASNEAYVTTLYRAMLEREPDPVGMADWTNRLRTQSRRQVLSGFVYSNEFQKKCERFGIRRGNL